jgi:undecaprenyl diphosphate synthase
MQLLQQYLIEERSTILQQRIRLAVIGRRDGIPADVLREMDKTIFMSQANTGLRLCLAINYGGRQELTDAVIRIARQVRDGTLPVEAISESVVSDNLSTAGMPDPDLLIRTAGEMRVSNFLLWQISYAEIWVTHRFWPEFDEAALHEAIRDYAARERRFGGLSGK